MFKGKASRRVATIASAAASAAILSLTLVSTAGAAVRDDPTPTPAGTAQFGGVPTPRPVPVQRNCDNVRISTFAPTASPTDGRLRTVSPNPDNQVTPTDEVSPTDSRHVKPTPTPTINPQVRCRPEHFNIALTLAGNTVITNYAAFTGPVSGVGTDDLNVSTNTFDRFSLPGLAQRVNLLHTGIPFPSISLANCTASVLQLGVWRFNGGPVGSVFRNSIGNGTFRLAAIWHFPNLRGVCSLRFIIGNPLLQNRIDPDFTVVGVHGDGVARR